MTRLRFALLLLVACGSKPPPVGGGGSGSGTDLAVVPDAGVDKPGPVVLGMAPVTSETPFTSAWGASITIPANWWIGYSDTLVRVQAPEQDLTLTMLTVDAADAATAFTSAWQRVDPTFDLPIAQADELPGSEGWDAMAQTVYVTPTEASRVVVAFGRKHGGTWHVGLFDGATAAFDRRGAQLNSIVFDMKVPGIEEENWAGKVAQLGAVQLETFEAFVESARVAAGVPGVALAVVHGGKIVLEKGFGTRTVGKKAKAVKPGTAFLIGSTSKSLSTLMMARVIDAKKLTWDTKLTELLPWFALGDADVTTALTLQHTVCACTGLPRQDLEFLFESSGWTAEQKLEAMKTMVPTTGFGETFQYSNTMVAAGGYAAAHAYAPKKKLGPAYDAAMQALVFDPLGMKSTTLDFAKAQKGDWAHPHAQDFELAYTEIPIAYEQAVSAVRPAGGVWSTAHDMAQYLLLELARGKTVKGKQLVSEENLLHRREPQVKIAEGYAYGLGLFVSDEHGVQVIHHGGNMLGFTSDMVFFPEADLGFVLLTNGGAANGYRGAVRARFTELLYDGKLEAQTGFDAGLALDQKSNAEQLALLVATPEASWIQRVLGVWSNDALGRITLRQKDGKLTLDAGEWQSEFTEMIDRDGTAKVITITPPYIGFTFVPTGTADRPVLRLDAGQQVYDFVAVGSE